MSSIDPFESPKFLLNWVDEEVLHLESVINGIITEGDYLAVVTDHDSESGYNIIKVRLTKPLPIGIRGRVNNILKNLRDALDQAVFQAAVQIRGGNPRASHFPFGESPDDLENSLSLRKSSQCKDIPPELYPILRSFEPYPTGDAYTGGNDFLRALGRITGPHKHRFTISPGIDLVDGQIISIDGPVHFPLERKWDASKNEMILAWFSGQQDVKIRFGFQIAFSGIPHIDDAPIIAAIQIWRADVSRVIDDLQREVSSILAART